MGQKMYNVTIQGITKQYPEKIPYSEIVKEYEGSTDAPVMLVIVNGRLRELHKHLKADCEIEFVTSKDPIGHKTYCRSASLILLKAIYDVAGQENIDSVMIHYSVGSGYYFTMKGPMALDQEFIDKVKAQMHRIVDENLPKGIILIFHHKIKYIPACSASEAVIHLLRRCYRKRGSFLIMKRTKSKIGTSSFVQLHILGYNIYNIILHPDFFNDIV